MGGEWQKCLFECAPLQILDGDRGKNYPSRSEFTSSGHCIFLNTGNVTQSGFKFAEIDFISKERDELLRKGKLQRQDVILTTRGTVGNVAYFHDQIPYDHIRINSGMIILRPDQNYLDSRFLYQFLRSQLFNAQVEALRTGSAQPQLPIRDIKKVAISYPELSDQKSIAHILGTLDDKIELNRRMNATLEAMAQALFKSWFVDFDPVIDNALVAGNPIPEPLHARAETRAALGDQRKPLPEAIQKQFPSRFVFSEEMGWIPEGWEQTVSGNVIDVRDGTHDSPKQSEKGFPLVTSKHITSGSLKLEDAYLISEEDYKQVNQRSRVESGDILLTMIGTVGVPCLVVQSEVNFAIKNIGLFRTSQSQLFKYFFFLLLKTHGMKNYLDARMAGTTQKYLSLNVLRNIEFTSPPDNLLESFNCQVSVFMKQIRQHEEEIATLLSIRDTLLPKLLSGQLRIPDAEKLVAEAI